MAAPRLDALVDRLDPLETPLPQALVGQVIVAAADRLAARMRLAGAALRALAAVAERPVVEPGPASEWPFTHPLAVAGTWPHRAVLWVPDLHDAFENAQTNSTRLVTTQSPYILQIWHDALATRPDVTFLASAASPSLAEHAPEALTRRGLWRQAQLLEDAAADTGSVSTPADPPRLGPLAAAFRDASPAARLAAVGRALDEARTPARLLAMTSVCMEVNDLDNAAALADELVTATPEWAAAHFEAGKLWLRRDDMARAAEAFGRASALMPSFASAAANWGATLGELDRPEEALAAFTRALAGNPENHQALNNLGVVCRELGRLAESEAAFRQVIALTPGLAFGHYNLGHTLFLQGRYQASLAAYSVGQRNDPARNPVQASRMALARLATGDAAGALRELQTCTATLPPGYRRQVLEDTHTVAWALLSAGTEVPGWQLVGDWLSAELARG